MPIYVLLGLELLVRHLLAFIFLRETRYSSGVSAAYHLSQAIANGKLGKGKSLTAVILEARDFCKFFIMILLLLV